MTQDQLKQAFKRAQDRAREAWSADEVVKIIEELQAVTWDYLAMPEDMNQLDHPKPRCRDAAVPLAPTPHEVLTLKF